LVSPAGVDDIRYDCRLCIKSTPVKKRRSCREGELVRCVHLAAAVGAALAFCATTASAADCSGLAGRRFGEAVITRAAEVAPGAFIEGDRPQTAGPQASRPFCRVAGVIRPSADSDIRFEVWLPPPGAWNGRYQGVGNGGFAGSIAYGALDRALLAGYAASATDTGHRDATTGEARDTRWALGHPEKVIDYGWRGIHLTALTAKAVILAYYSRPPKHAYFVGCSTGGRQALMEAQRFPTDYDGVVAGAPGNMLTALLTWDLDLAQAVDARPEGWLGPAKLALLNKAALADCGGVDGVVGDPDACRFDPGRLRCKSGQAQACLTGSDVALVRRIYSGLRDLDGRLIYPGFAPGGEAAWNWGPDSRLRRLAAGFFGDLVVGDPQWSLDRLAPSEALALARRRTSQTLDADDPDLRAFRRAGGKLIVYHGWNDSRIPPAGSIRYYQAVAARTGGLQSARSFYRLFLGPGVEHCSAGPGPDAIGGAYGPPAPSQDPAHDVVAALAHWVEDGVAPEQITATLYRNSNSPSDILAQRPWCAYPALARFNGTGDPGQASGYACVAPQASAHLLPRAANGGLVRDTGQ
jgi:feruloyl esterase